MARSDQKKKKKKKNGTLMLSVKQSQPHFIEDSFKILFLQNSFRQNVVKKNCEKKFYQNEAGREGEQVFWVPTFHFENLRSPVVKISAEFVAGCGWCCSSKHFYRFQFRSKNPFQNMSAARHSSSNDNNEDDRS